MYGTVIESQFYGDELTTVRITKSTTYIMDKILDKQYRNGILQYLVRWKCYRKEFASWVPAASVNNILIMNGNPNSFYVTLFINI